MEWSGWQLALLSFELFLLLLTIITGSNKVFKWALITGIFLFWVLVDRIRQK